MAESDVPNPNSTLIYFILVTICFLFFTVFNVFSATTTDDINNAKNNNMINLAYMLLIVIGSYFINANISKAMCEQSIQWNYVLMATLLPWTIIFVTLYFILALFPGWISPFSNTIGYIFISILGIEGVLTAILDKDKVTPPNTEILKAINNIKSNRSNFINQIDTDKMEFDKFIGEFNANFKIVPDNTKLITDPDIIKLYKLITIKHVVGKIVWYILAGILISSISYNYIINISCEKSLDQIKADFEKSETKTGTS